ncbi:MAG: aminotransferase class V-fold PLP-dependent enzyme [Planctomycetaceae bacterium]
MSSVPAVTSPRLDVEAVRRDFPILSRVTDSGRPLVYLDSGATAQKPNCVIDKLAEVFREYNSNVHFTPIQFGLRNLDLAAVDIVVVWGSLVWLIVAIWPHFRWVSVAQIPYLIWVSIATVLQLSITWNNRP